MNKKNEFCRTKIILLNLLNEKIAVVLGSNIGDRQKYLENAKTMIEIYVGHIAAASSHYETEAWGKLDEPAYINQVLLIATHLPSGYILNRTQYIEQHLNRQRKVKWGARTIDIDLLFMSDEVVQTPYLQIPHPHIADRRFVLEPLCELIPNYVHPVENKPIHLLLAECKDMLSVKKIH